MAGVRSLVDAVVSLPNTRISGDARRSQSECESGGDQKISTHLSATVIKRSNIIEVSFRSHDAAWARAFLARLMTAYLALHARLSQNPQAQAFFQPQRGLLDRTVAAIGKSTPRRAIANRNLSIHPAETGSDNRNLRGRGGLSHHRRAARFQDAADRQPGSRAEADSAAPDQGIEDGAEYRAAAVETADAATRNRAGRTAEPLPADQRESARSTPSCKPARKS